MGLNNNWIKYSNAGFQIIATLALFGCIGYFLDQNYPTLQPLFLILSLLIGIVVSLYHLWTSVFK